MCVQTCHDGSFVDRQHCMASQVEGCVTGRTSDSCTIFRVPEWDGAASTTRTNAIVSVPHGTVECDSGFILDDTTCVSCQERFGDTCLECTATACVSSSSGVVGDDGRCAEVCPTVLRGECR